MSKKSTQQQDLTFVEDTNEHFRPTGIEYEEPGAESVPTKPYDPEQIRVDPKTFSLRQILDMIDDGDLELAPDFQRLKVWTAVQKSRLIESVLLRIPLPAFYFSSDKLGKLQVVDGLQRLSTIHDFVRGGKAGNDFFRLVGLEYLQEQVGGLNFADIDSPLWTRRINSTQIISHVIDPQTPYAVKFDIFRRINTGGSPLNAQEIRHCLSQEQSRTFLKSLANLQSFRLATREVLLSSPRMVDREVVLRFCAFYRVPGEPDYAKLQSFDEFLNKANEHLDATNDAELKELKGSFDRAMQNAHNLLGENAFRKWPLDADRLRPFNRSLFDVFSVCLAQYEWRTLEQKVGSLVSAFRQLCTSDQAFIDSISSSTGDTRRVAKRFEAIRKLLKEAGL